VNDRQHQIDRPTQGAELRAARRQRANLLYWSWGAVLLALVVLFPPEGYFTVAIQAALACAISVGSLLLIEALHRNGRRGNNPPTR